MKEKEKERKSIRMKVKQISDKGGKQGAQHLDWAQGPAKSETGLADPQTDRQSVSKTYDKINEAFQKKDLMSDTSKKR